MASSSELEQVMEGIHERASDAAEILFHLGAEAAFAIVLAALRDGKRYQAWLGPGALVDEGGLSLVVRYLEHVIKEETTDG